jgi:hypothetical protein
MLHSMRCLWQDLRRVHHILEPLEEELPAKAGLTAETAACCLAAGAAGELPAC